MAQHDQNNDPNQATHSGSQGQGAKQQSKDRGGDPHARERGNGRSQPDADSTTSRLYDRGVKVRDEAAQFASVVEDAAKELETFLREQLSTRPYLTLGVVAGAGYILGGGIPSRLTRLAFDIGTKMVVANVASAMVGKGLGEALNPSGGSSSGGSQGGRS